MRDCVLLLLLAAGPLVAAASDFNGRWDIEIPKEPRHRAWWLEVSGAGTPDLKGRFVGFPGGDMLDIQKIWIEGDVLHFTFDQQNKKANQHLEYTARTAGKELKGTYTSGKQSLEWIGHRAPVIKEKDDGSWKDGKPVDLFDGKDLKGWHGIVPGQALGWTVADGLLSSTGGANNLETDAKYWNFKLHVEYRVGAHSNSGIGLRGRYEVQILEDKDRPVDRHSNGALYSRIIPSENVSKPAGEWQTCDIRLVGMDVTVVLNGKQVVKGVIEGLTAIATDWEEGKPGMISLQGDHGPVDFRKVVLTPLVK
jgi:3-keto-disaccharide hydrolase